MKKKDWIYILIMIMPIVDLISSVVTRNFENALTLGMILKTILILLSVIYVFFFSHSKYKKIGIIYYILLFLYVIFYFVFKSDLLSFNLLKNEFRFLFKFMYFPSIFIGLLNYFEEKEFDREKLNKVMIVSFITYILLIAVPTILSINYSSYVNNNYYGSIGFFYSANEVSVILLLMFPFIYTLLDKSKILTIVLYAAGLYTISLIGTKVTLFGVIIVCFLILLSSLLRKGKKFTVNNLIILLMLVTTILFMINNYSAMNLRSSLSNEEVQDRENLSQELNDYYKGNAFVDKFKQIGSKLLSDRDVYALNTYKMFTTRYEKGYTLFGMGFANTERIDNIRVEKLIEIDILDVFFHMGVVAILLLAFPFVLTLCILIKSKKKIKNEVFFFIMMILLTYGISSTAGHVYLAPAVTLYVCIYTICLLDSCSVFTKKNINGNKISILALHLGYGGIENAIVNKANMLVDNFDVEIISLYKQKIDIPFKLDKRVTVTYLMNSVSNREEFNEALKNKKIIGVLSEGFKAVRILLNKNKLMKNAIRESDARIIISTRYSFSKLLSNYKRNDVVSMHEEHTYNVDDMYIRKLSKLNVDYILPVSKRLTSEYESLGEKLKFIPLPLSYFPIDDEVSKLDSKNLIAVGRLENEKGFSDLIDVMEDLVKKDNNIKLNIFGDGSLKSELSKMIKDKKLDKNVKLWGFKKFEFIKKYYQESSLYVMTSFEESFGLVLIEAMSFGVPCITFDSAKGALDLVDKNTGFVVKGRDKKKMVNKIVQYLEMTQRQRKAIGKNARLKAENYKLENIKKQWLDFLKGL